MAPVESGKYPKMTERQKRFCELYALGGNRAKAARDAGYADGGASVVAGVLLAKPHIASWIDELRRVYLDEIGVRSDRVLDEIAASAFLDPKDVLDEDGDLLPIPEMPERARRAIKKIKVRNRYDKKTGEQTGRDVEIEFNDKLRANEILGRHLGILKEQPIQVAQTNVFAQIIESAQGSALMPIAQRDEDDTSNDLEGDAHVIEGEIVEKEDTPTTKMVGGNSLEAFNAIDGGEEETDAESESEQGAVVEPVAKEEVERAIPESERRAFKSLWKRPRRRNV